MDHKNLSAYVIHRLGGISMLVLPVSLLMAFALHFTALSDFFAFTLTKPTYSAEHLLQTLNGPDGGYRQYMLPHMVGYLALPLFVPVSLILAKTIYKRCPWHALIGAALTCIGVVFMGGVFGAWLSFAAIIHASGVAAPDLLAVLHALTSMQGALLLSSVMSALTFIGMIILGFGVYLSHEVPRWSSVLIILGNIMILAFMDIDNWMLLGALMMFVGMLPIAMKFFHAKPEMSTQEASMA